MGSIATKTSRIHKLLNSPADLLMKVNFLVDCLEETHFDLGEWQETLKILSQLVSPSDMVRCLQELERRESAEAKFARSEILESLGRFADAGHILENFSCSQVAELEVLRLQSLARNKILAGESASAVLPLKTAIRMSTSLRSVTSSARILKMLGVSGPQSCKRTVRLAIIGNATFELMLPQLKAMGFSYGLNLELFAGAYNQHAQEILDPNSSLKRFNPDVIVIATNIYSLGLGEESNDENADIAEKTREITSLWSSCLQAFPSFLIQHNFAVPEVSSFGRLSNSLPGGRARLLRKLNAELEDAAANAAGVIVLDVEQIASVLGKRNWEDERMWIQAKQYPSAAGIVPLLKHLTALVRSRMGLASKCVVLDLDNTLWGGVVGEEGVEGIQLGGTAKGEAYVAFQSYLLGLHQRGIILAVCSKNNEADAVQPFNEHPEMLLKRDHISVFLANWRSKSENLREVAARLNIGLDSLVFVDDNPVERELVRNQLAEVEVPEMPEDPSLFAATLHRELLFEAINLTGEDRHRGDTYKANLERQNFEQSSSSLEDFLSGLRMHVSLKRFDSVNEPRIVQLINKTNQFNLTTLRMSDVEVRAYALKKDSYTQFVQLRDRFGDNGIVGIMMASVHGQSLRIDQWLMSCRVLGRRMETVMLSAVWNYAQSCGHNKLVGIYSPTAKNVQVADLYNNFGFVLVQEDSNGTRYYEIQLSGDFPPPAFFTIEDRTNVSTAVGGR